MSRRSKGLGGLLLAVYLAPAALSAGTISIGITQRLEIGAGEITAVVTVSNSGDEAAHSVAVMLEILGTELQGERRALLEPGNSYDERLTGAVVEAEGRWPYRVVVDYTDANQYPFQALSVAIFERGSPPPSPIVVTSVEVPGLNRQGSVSVRVQNVTQSERMASLRVMVPRGVEMAGEAVSLALAPWQELDVDVALVNRFALAGSRYPIYVVVEFDDHGFHQSVVASSDLEIVEAVPLAESSHSQVWIAAIVLGVLFTGLLVWRLAAR